MNIYLSSGYLKAYKKILRKKPYLNSKVKKALKTLQENPRHSSLRLHKLGDGSYKNWSISIEKDVRLLFSYVKDGIILVDIGSHNKVY